MRRGLLSLAALGLLASCQEARPAFDPEPLFPATEGVSRPEPEAATPAPATAPWIRIDLPAVLALAGAGDLEIASARERLAELEANRDEALTRFFPALQPEVSFQQAVGEYMDTSGTFVDVTRQQTLAGVRARLELDLGNAVFGLQEAAHRLAGGESALAGERNRQLMLAARSYYDLLAAVQQVEIAREALDFARAQLAYHESQRRQGFGLAVDVERARARSEAEEIALADAQLGYRAASNALAVDLRLDPRVSLYPGERDLAMTAFIPSGATVDQLVRTALGANPDVDAARSDLDAREARLSAATWDWLIPSLFLEGSLDERGENPRRFGDTEGFAAGVQWEISLGQGARRRSAQARRNQAAIALARARERLVGAVVTLHDRQELHRKRVAAAERRIQAARSALAFAESRMRSGAGLALEVLDARVELTRAQRSRLRAIVEFNKAQVSLLVLTGATPRAKAGEQP